MFVSDKAAHLDDVNMLDEEIEDFDFVATIQESEFEKRRRRLVDQMIIEEASSSSQEHSQYSSSRKQDREGKFRYFDSSDEEYGQEEQEEETKNGSGGKANQTFTGSQEYNRETLQAQMYDRTFILNGPVVKVYQTAEDYLGKQFDQAQMSHVTDLPIIMNRDHDTVMPSNLLLHDGEG